MSYIINYVESLNRFFGFFCSYTWRSAIPQGLGCRKHHRIWPMTWLMPWPTTLTKFPRTRTRWKADDCPMISWENNGKHVFSMSLAVVKKLSNIFSRPWLCHQLPHFDSWGRNIGRGDWVALVRWSVGNSMNWCYKLAVSLRQNGVCWILNSCISFHFTRDTRVIVFVPCKQWQLCALATAAHLLQRVSKPTDSAHGEDELLMTRANSSTTAKDGRKELSFFCGSLHAKHWISTVEECVKCS